MPHPGPEETQNVGGTAFGVFLVRGGGGRSGKEGVLRKNTRTKVLME